MPLPTNPQLSVIMTVYNGEDFIQETLDSVWAQTFQDFELVVVNNGCTDGTQDILDANTDERLRVVQAPQHGTFGDGIRLAYENAKGEYIAVQDADDVSLPDRFALQVHVLNSFPLIGLVSGSYQRFFADGELGEVVEPPTDRQGLVDTFQVTNPLAHSSYMYRRQASDSVGGYADMYQFGADFGLVIRMMKEGWNVYIIKDVILKLRSHAGQTSHNPAVAVDRTHDSLHLLLEASGLDGASVSAKLAGRRAIAKARIQYGLALSQNQRLGGGLGQILRSFLTNPLYSLTYLGYRFGCRIGVLKPRGA